MRIQVGFFWPCLKGIRPFSMLSEEKYRFLSLHSIEFSQISCEWVEVSTVRTLPCFSSLLDSYHVKGADHVEAAADLLPGLQRSYQF
jgi:hypothetical protein